MVVDLLVARIPPAVTAAELEFDEPAFCVALSYGDGSCLPVLNVGLDSERDDAEWNPAEFRYCDLGWATDEDQTLAEAADLFDQEMALAGEFDRIRDVLVAAARQLNAVDWTMILPVTADFLVYPVDYECCDVDRNLAEYRR